MKFALISAAIAITLASGCASTSSPNYEPNAPTKKAVSVDIPKWYINPPAMTDKSIFVPGTGVSTDLTMATHKAMLDADSKLAFQMESQIKAMIKSYKNDVGESVIESSEILSKKIANVTINGHHQVDMKATQENNKFRVFVLMRYPTGDANYFANMIHERAAREGARIREEQMSAEIEETTVRSTAPSVGVTTVTPIEAGNNEFVSRAGNQVDPTSLPSATIADEQLRNEIREILKRPDSVVITGTMR